MLNLSLIIRKCAASPRQWEVVTSINGAKPKSATGPYRTKAAAVVHARFRANVGAQDPNVTHVRIVETIDFED